VQIRAIKSFSWGLPYLGSAFGRKFPIDGQARNTAVTSGDIARLDFLLPLDLVALALRLGDAFLV
jgi:hypothetical protein